MNAEAEKIIARLGLVPLPGEGGFFRQTWVSPERSANGRAAASEIWFLMTPGDFSALHRLRSEELWSFSEGDPVEHVQLISWEAARVTILGKDSQHDQQSEVVVPGGVWQGARLKVDAGARGYALLRCTVRPAW